MGFAMVLAAAAAFFMGFFIGKKYCFYLMGTVYKREYSRTNGLYEPVRRD